MWYECPHCKKTFYQLRRKSENLVEVAQFEEIPQHLREKRVIIRPFSFAWIGGSF